MKKIVKVSLIVLQVLSLIVSCCYGFSAIQKRNWVKTDAVVTFIGKPQGVVFGDYTDDKGIFHSDKALYDDVRFLGHGSTVEPYYGKQVKILYNPLTEEIISYDNFLTESCISIVIFIITSVILWTLNKKRMVNK